MGLAQVVFMSLSLDVHMDLGLGNLEFGSVSFHWFRSECSFGFCSRLIDDYRNSGLDFV